MRSSVTEMENGEFSTAEVDRLSGDPKPYIQSTKCCSVFHRLKTDAQYRQNIARTSCLYFNLFIIGYAKGQTGPSLIDLQSISKVGLEKGSWIISAIFCGYLAGSITGGFAFSKVRVTLLLGSTSVLLASTTALIPWCSMFWLMISVVILFGFSLGVMDTVCSADVQSIWGQDGRTYMQGLQLMYAIGIALSPVVTSPFLTKLATKTGVHHMLVNDTVVDHCISNQEMGDNQTAVLTEYCCESPRNVSNSTECQPESQRQSQLFIAYLFTTVLGLLVCLAFVTFYLRFERHDRTHRDEDNTPCNVRRIPTLLKCLTLGTLACVSGLICCIDDTFLGFLTTFCVQYLHWTKQNGAFLTSVSSCFVVVGRLLATCIIRYTRPMTLTGIHCVITLASFIGLYISAVNMYTVGVWVSSIAFGFGKSAILASVFSWIEEVLIPVRGKVASLVFIVITTLTVINPLVIGHLMDHIENIWFVLLLLGESGLLLAIYIIAVMLSNVIIAKYGYTYNESPAREENTLMGKSETPVTNEI